MIRRSYPASTASAYLQLNEQLSPNRYRLVHHDTAVSHALHQSCLTAGSWTKGLPHRVSVKCDLVEHQAKWLRHVIISERIESNPSQTTAARRVNSGTRFSAAWRWLAILKTDAKRNAAVSRIRRSCPSVADPSNRTLLLTESPFSIRLLECENEHSADASRQDREQLLPLLPTVYRAESGDLAAAGRQVTALIKDASDPLFSRKGFHVLLRPL